VSAVNPILMPVLAPPDIGTNTITTQRELDQGIVECAICRATGGCTEFRVDIESNGTMDERDVQKIARHLFLAHYITPLARVAREGLRGDVRPQHDADCRCQFCSHRQTCTTPGDVNCKEGPSDD